MGTKWGLIGIFATLGIIASIGAAPVTRETQDYDAAHASSMAPRVRDDHLQDPDATPEPFEALYTLDLPVLMYHVAPISRYLLPDGKIPPGWRWHEPGAVTIPILLYHRIADVRQGSRYIVSTRDFEAQMLHLRVNGYTTIPLGLLVEAMEYGAYLPPFPVVITFDDGYRDVFKNAFPILQRNQFTGVVYVIASHMEIGGYLNVEELKALAAAGWEIGSHSSSHANLRKAGVNLTEEITASRQALRVLLEDSGTPVDSFSFPFGLTTPFATQLVKDAGYQNAVGLGGLSRHAAGTRYYLSRIEVPGETSLDAFSRLLPWEIQPRSPQRWRIEEQP